MLVVHVSCGGRRRGALPLLQQSATTLLAENSHFDYTARYGQCYRLYRKQPQPEQIHLSAAADFPASISPSAQIISA